MSGGEVIIENETIIQGYHGNSTIERQTQALFSNETIERIAEKSVESNNLANIEIKSL